MDGDCHISIPSTCSFASHSLKDQHSFSQNTIISHARTLMGRCL
uniref:Uncharacterized protein n=1 Tax=Populus trichocarpa TaxID=3694 RepID=A0A3N7FAI9_POPTR